MQASSTVWYKNANIYGKLTDIAVRDGKFYSFERTSQPGIDLEGQDVFPGLIDIHCHGCLGHDIMEGLDHLEEMSRFFAQNGVTTWYPTFGAGRFESLLDVLRQPMKTVSGTNIPGYHMEGPYTSPKFLGSGADEFVRTPNFEEIAPYLGNVKLMTLAPEVEGGIDFLRQLPCKVVMGHTGADYETTIKAIEAGADCVTHIFNAMVPLNHREPGVLGAAFERGIYAQLICDGVHIHKSVVKMVYQLFGKRTILISDATSSMGLPDGVYYTRSTQKRILKDGAIRTERGNLAGSASSLFRDVKKAIEFGIPREEAFYLASGAPAEYMGLKKGKLVAGYDADFIVVDKENNLKQTVIGGKSFQSS